MEGHAKGRGERRDRHAFAGDGALKDSQKSKNRIDQGTRVAHEETLLLQTQGAHKKFTGRHCTPKYDEGSENYSRCRSKRSKAASNFS